MMQRDSAIDSEGRKDITTALTSTEEIAHATDRIVTARIITNIARERRMSLTGRMAALTDRARDFNKKTEGVLDAIEDKINKADTKLNVAAEKHHGYYDGIIAGVDDSVEVIDRLSNGPLGQDGER